MPRLIAIAMVAAVLIPPACSLAQDRDADGLPDTIESQLGTNPDLDEGLQLVIDDKPRGQGDTNIGPGPDAPDVDKVYFAHVAEDRYVWKVTFTTDYPASGTVFHLYTDIDDEKATGRQDGDWVRGVDMMYSMVDAKDSVRINNPQVRADQRMPVRMAVAGNAIYACDDLSPAAMKLQDGKTQFRMFILSHMKDTPTDSDTTVWLDCRVATHPERKAPPLPFPVLEGFEGLTMPDFTELTYRLWRDPANVCLQPKDATIEGYTLLMSDELDGPEGDVGSVTWRCPVTGTYRIGLLLNDTAPQIQGLDLLLNDRKVGTIAGCNPTSRDVLYFTTEPVQLNEGDKLQVKTSEHGGKARFQRVCLLADRPGVPELRIESITAWHVPDEPGQPRQRVMVAWTTNRPAEASVQYALAGPEAFEQNGTIEEGRGAVNNHFVYLPPELRASGYRLTITCKEPPQESYEAMAATAEYTVWMDPKQHRPDAAETPADAATSVRLTVHEPTGQARTGWPVTSGVPLPRGVLQNPHNCRVVDAGGNPVPAQFLALAWYPDSIWVKWLQVDVLASTQANGDAEYTLQFGETGPEPPVAVKVTGAGPVGTPEDRRPADVVQLPLRIDTGPLLVELGEGGFAPFAQATLDGKPVGEAGPGEGGIELTDAEGKVYSSALSAPDEVLLESRGPLRATVCVKGNLTGRDGTGFMRYVCRLSYFAGKPYVRAQVSLDNDVAQPDMNRFSSLQVRVPAALAEATVTCGGDGKALDVPAAAGLLQDDDNHFSLGTTEGKRAEGWLLARSDERSVAVAVRDFWQRYPKGLRTDEGGVAVQLLPPLPEDQYKGVSDDDLTKLYYWCDGGKYKIRTGVRVTTDFAVDFAPDLQTADGGYALGASWQAPLFLACSPEWYCHSGAFGPMVPRRQGAFDQYEKSLDSAFARFLQRRETVREYGFLNYGDWFGERTWNWGNGEYDTQWALAVNFARTGNLGMLWAAEQAERHKADVDTVHYWGDPRQVGAEWEHGVGHTGGYFPDGWKDMGTWATRGSHDTGHTWAQGHFYLYALTGDPSYLETGRLVADWLVGRTTDFGFYCERNAGWPLVAVTGAYNTTGNPIYLNAAKIIADGALWRMHPERHMWGHFQDSSECKHRPQCWVSKPFMTGVLLHGLKMYDLLQPQDDVKQAIIDNTRFLWRECYVEADMGFCYSLCSTFVNKGGPWTISLVGDGLAYGCLLDPEHKDRELLLQATSANLYRSPVDAFGKTFTQGLCFMPQMLHDLTQLGLTTIPEPPPPPAKTQAQLRREVFVTAGSARTVRPLIGYSAPAGGLDLPCGLSVITGRSTWFSVPAAPVRWTAPLDTSLGPEIMVAAPSDARPGDTQTLRTRVRYGDKTDVFRVRATVVAPQRRGDRIGWISGEADPLRLAAEALGVEPIVLTDARRDDLSRYATLILGSEALNKNFCNVAEAVDRVGAWVIAGGRLIVGQLNDGGWDVAMLPFDLGLSDAETTSGGIVRPGHPLFTSPNRIADLSGVVSYDTITAVSGDWDVLLASASGGPSIIEGRAGEGRVLVVMPSFDRPVAGVDTPDMVRLPACRALIENLLHYAGYPATTT